MARLPLDCREWLDDMRCGFGRDSEFASQALDELDRGRAADDEAQAWSDTGFKNPDEAQLAFRWLAEIREELEEYDFAREIADDREDVTGWIRQILEYAEAKEAQSFALQDLCIAAGIIKPNDYRTDPLPLLRMFLPVD